MQAEGPVGLRIRGSNGFQIHQIRNLRILEWIWKNSQIRSQIRKLRIFYGLGEILKIRSQIRKLRIWI